MVLANGATTFPIKDNLAFSNGPKILPRNPADFTILWNWVFESFTLADDPFAKALRAFKTCVLFNNNLCGILFSSL